MQVATTFDSAKADVQPDRLILDTHHIFPARWCESKAVAEDRCDSIVNKTAISAKTNRMIGGAAPSTYLGKLEKSAGISTPRMDDILRSHVIDPALLRADDFDGFFGAREKSLLRRIEAAMGKSSLADLTDAPGEVDLGA